MIFSLRNIPIETYLAEVKFLGIVVDSKLSWEPHIKYITGRLSRVIYLLRNLKSHVSDTYVRTAYFAFFQSIISYGIVLWGNCSHTHEILLLQKKVLRVITNSDKYTHCKSLFIKLKVLTVINLYIYNALLYTKNNLSMQQYRQDIHSYNTRSNRRIDIPYHQWRN